MSTSPLKIGAFGTGNIGEDLMLQAILISEPTSEVIAYGKPLLPFEIPYISRTDFLACPEKYLKKSTSVDFGGGNLFWSEQNLCEMLVITQQAKLAGLPVRLNRVGLQGFEQNKDYARLLLKLVESVSVRDSDSFEIAKMLGRYDCEISKDYVFNLFNDREVSQPPLSLPIRVGINFADSRFTSEREEDQGFINHISGIFAELARIFGSELEFYYIPFCIHRTYSPENDLIAAARLWTSSEGLIHYIDDISNTNDLIRSVDSMDILIGHRFHMQVLGYALKKFVIPMVQRDHSSDKYTAIAIDNGVIPICYEGISQGFILERIQRRLMDFIRFRIKEKL
ncbi:MAG: polysaccharide pyruvyl transferase family protein [Chlorobiaceae bacterium]|nr:polysaccharide pyruvyl transferase family protein [Chlorobiaceae bacterium]